MSIGVYIIIVSNFCWNHSYQKAEFQTCTNQMAECINQKKSVYDGSVYWHCIKHIDYMKPPKVIK